MADLATLEAHDAEVREAEKTALLKLAACMKLLIRDVPSESKLCRVLLKRSREIEIFASGTDAPPWVDVALRHMVEQELREAGIDFGEDE